MSENCPKVTHGAATIQVENEHHLESYDGASLVAQVIRVQGQQLHALAAQLAAETKRADELDVLVKQWQLIEDELCKSLAAAEQAQRHAEGECERMRNGIEEVAEQWLSESIGRGFDKDINVGVVLSEARWQLAALLAPREAAEAKDV